MSQKMWHVEIWGFEGIQETSLVSDSWSCQKERFNDFIQFVTFGNRGTIAANSRDEQRKIIKYGHLVANILIFMNVHDQSEIMSELIKEEHVITKEQAACLAPYRKANTNRFGAYFLDELRDVINIGYYLPLVSLYN